MQTSLNPAKAAPQKVKNILVRHACCKIASMDSHYQHPETPYILKYAPKYYKSLTLQATCQSPLLSKVKKIKKLKRFTGYFNRHLPQQLWFNLLGNNRKEIEEVPQISSNKMRVRPSKAFWEKLNQQKLKNFWNVTRIWLPKLRDSYLRHDMDNFLSNKESFVKYLWNMRRLNSLKITVKNDNYDNIKWFLGKLDGMDRLFKRLETLSLDAVTHNQNIQELFQNKTFFSHLTGLNLSLEFEPIFAEIPLWCKNLNSLSLDFQSGVDEKPEFRNLLTSMQQLTRLESLEFAWPTDGKDFWSHFKPQPSLQYLQLRISSNDLLSAGLFEEDNLIEAVAHWEQIKELKVLECSLTCNSLEEFDLMRMFMTLVLGKVLKIETLKFWIGATLENEDPQETYEPFFVEDVPHLYGSLERFEYELYSWIRDVFVKFDLEALKPFGNLKSLKLEGSMELNENIEEIVSLLERNQKEGEYPWLELNLKRSIESPAEWLRNILNVLERTKKMEKDLKVIIDLTFGLRDYMEILEALCQEIQSVRTIKGLRIRLKFNDDYDDDGFSVEKIRELSRRYPRIRNLDVELSNGTGFLEWIKIDGEKEQLFLNRY